MKILHRDDPDYDRTLQRLAHRGDDDLERVAPAVAAIVADVRQRGDAALDALAERFDGAVPVRRVFDRAACAAGLLRLERDQPAVAAAMGRAAARIRAFHEAQHETGRRWVDPDGVSLGWRVRPLDRVGVYAPGGKARYPSSVLMSAIPATVAGVPEVLVATPRPTDDLLAAAALSGVTAVYDMGGAGAVAAFAYGTESVPRVDKIVGPGNLYVACAKRMVFGRVAIDGIAGPSEILVVADDGANPDVVAADLLSQAEHDEAAYAILVTLSADFAARVVARVAARLETLPRRDIAAASLAGQGIVVVVNDLDEASRVATLLAAEHLSLQVRDPEALWARVGAAGAVFLGDDTPEAAGDYLAGPSHVLPTGGAVRFSSPLGVYDFCVRSSVIRYDRAALVRHAGDIVTLAEAEGLGAHAQAVTARCGPESQGPTGGTTKL